MAETRNSLSLIKTDAKEIAIQEQADIKKDIVEARQRLGDFTLRDFSEGLFGEEFTQIVYGEKGGEVKMSELRMSMSGSPIPGEVGLKLDDAQMIEIIMEAHPTLTRDEAVALLTMTPAEDHQKALQHLAEHEDSIDDAVEDAHNAFKDIMMDEVGPNGKRFR